MPSVFRLNPGPVSADTLAMLKRSRVVLLEPSSKLEARLHELDVAFDIVGNFSIEADTLIVVPQTSLEDLVWVVDRLLGPGGCPWDQAQTHETLKKYLLEETYELLDAIDSGDDGKFVEELGDLMLQPVMHGQIRSLAGGFSTLDAAQAIVDKLIRRHPHVFGDVDVADADEVLRNWDRIKQTEKSTQPESLLAGVPKGMASLLRAHEVSKRAARAGFEWPNIESVFDKLHEEEAELKEALKSGNSSEVESEIGDLLFTAVNIARWAKIEPEEALRKMLNRFTERFQFMEQIADRDLRDLSPEEWDVLWNQAKSAQR